MLLAVSVVDTLPAVRSPNHSHNERVLPLDRREECATPGSRSPVVAFSIQHSERGDALLKSAGLELPEQPGRRGAALPEHHG